jgi:hypothetical protein
VQAFAGKKKVLGALYRSAFIFTRQFLFTSFDLPKNLLILLRILRRYAPTCFLVGKSCTGAY